MSLEIREAGVVEDNTDLYSAYVLYCQGQSSGILKGSGNQSIREWSIG